MRISFVIHRLLLLQDRPPNTEEICDVHLQGFIYHYSLSVSVVKIFVESIFHIRIVTASQVGNQRKNLKQVSIPIERRIAKIAPMVRIYLILCWT